MSAVASGGGGGVKLEIEGEACCVCGREDEELFSPEEHDAGGEPRVPLRTMLLQLNNNKVVPSGRLCVRCIQRAEDAHSFSQALAARGPPPLSEKIQALRKRLSELTQKIDVFIVVGGAGAAGGYSEEDVIMVERGALQAAERGDRARAGPAATYQCTQCPATYQRISEFRSHISGHGGAAHWCWSCGAAFPSAAQLEAHAARHAPEPLHCQLCDTRLGSAAALRAHEAVCAPLCPACGWLAPTRAELRAHAAAHPLLCRECFRLCASPSDRTAHAAAHAHQQHYVCGYRACILRFTTRSNLMAHIRKCHGGEEPPPAHPAPTPADASAPVACPHCPRTFGSTAAMKRHLRTHQDKEDSQEPEWQTAEGETETEGEAGRGEYLEVEALEDMEADH